MIPAHWYAGKGGRNFGDALTAVLFERLVGVRLDLVSPDRAQLYGVGSIAHRIPEGYTGWVWGTGYMWATQRGDLRTARVQAVRGAYTATAGRLDPTRVLLADPGLLAPSVVPARPRVRHRLGVAAHYADKDLRRRFRGRPIDVLAGVDHVVEHVIECRRIVSSSLHVLILADALGIENRWEPSDAVIGHGHKFRDYASAYRGGSIRPGEWRLADQDQVAEKAEALRRAMDDIIASFSGAGVPDESVSA